MLNGKATILCPRGKLRYAGDEARGYYYPDHLFLEREVKSAVAAFETRFEPRSAGEKYIYAGYSQGASMGALAFAGHGELFSQLILIEGGYKDLTRGLAERYVHSGGTGALFVCGTKACHDQAQSKLAVFKQLGLTVEVHYAPGAGHRPDGAVTRALLKALPRLLATDPRFNGLVLVNPDDTLHGNG